MLKAPLRISYQRFNDALFELRRWLVGSEAEHHEALAKAFNAAHISVLPKNQEESAPDAPIIDAAELRAVFARIPGASDNADAYRWFLKGASALAERAGIQIVDGGRAR